MFLPPNCRSRPFQASLCLFKSCSFLVEWSLISTTQTWRRSETAHSLNLALACPAAWWCVVPPVHLTQLSDHEAVINVSARTLSGLLSGTGQKSRAVISGCCGTLLFTAGFASIAVIVFAPQIGLLSLLSVCALESCVWRRGQLGLRVSMTKRTCCWCFYGVCIFRGLIFMSAWSY